MNHNISHDRLVNILVESLAATKSLDLRSNQHKSSQFVTELGNRIFHELHDSRLKLNVIPTREERKHKTAEEWILDITIAKRQRITERRSNSPFDYEIVWAIESESNCALSEFCRDFSKLLAVSSGHYLYAQGFSQLTKKGFDQFVQSRLSTASNLIQLAKVDPAEIYFAFWLSPAKYQSPKVRESLWEYLESDLSTRYSHLTNIYLFKYENPVFVSIGTASLTSGSS